MFKGRTFILILLAGVLAVAAAMMADNWLENQITTEPQQVEVTDIETVLTAGLRIPYGQKVQAQHLKEIQMPADLVPKGTAQNPDEVLGKIAQSDVFEGEILMQARFAESAEGSTLAALIEPSMRAITVRVNDVVGVAGFLLPGNRVDMLASRVQNKRSYTKTLIEDLKVLAVDQTAATNEKDPVIVRAVTLEVTPEQAEIIVKARGEGPIQLTLRNPQDDVIARKEAPRKPRTRTSKTASVTIIRGTSVHDSKVSL
ncbi:Flp pilus assembly protein CpaB [Amphritea balenae]|uniref:Flp pilus assembly protein CpaB n=1 Tax=Amphritea balenae TaxID=452629 RepID=A0A3P1SVC8_9GAMM|nr:Flp pilus assembly protein CpaB [Amphritea balenae]RRD01177.1 Flp pilus assembly protein CpaB [Amphritea balenae]GGK59300.1 Flp pilus assembly protein CpaB [Amphritea balenae]